MQAMPPNTPVDEQSLALGAFAVEPLIANDVVAYRPCWDAAEVERVLQTLELAGNRKGKAIVQRRRCPRRYYKAPVLVMGPRSEEAIAGPRRLMHLVSRNLSQSGICLIAPLFFEPEVSSKLHPMLRSTEVLKIGEMVELGLKKQSGPLLWLIASVIRTREVPSDFLEVGLRFLSRRICTDEFVPAAESQ
jgi:hypothetical protein